MFKTIVVGLDGSDGAKRALHFAVELARRDDARLVIAHVEQDIAGKGGGPIHPDEPEIQAEIDRQASEVSSEGIETRVEKATIFAGGPGSGIADIADRVDADLIVVGTRGHSSVLGVVLGSVAQRLLHLAHHPVLVIPPDARLLSDSKPSEAGAAA
ncbi:MAG TPA: universal stress protein [Solirubrobacterales bacterium]|jgi:nucleotide-binding universal stress UspA family protein|nr:universal stress protein [Solirubrobacterales bacterium]